MRLKELRENKKTKIEDLAKMLCISIQAYYKYEKGTNEPNMENLCKLADYYNVTLDYLVGRDYANDLGYLDELETNTLQIAKQLNTNNKMQLLAYASGLLTAQK